MSLLASDELHAEVEIGADRLIALDRRDWSGYRGWGLFTSTERLWLRDLSVAEAVELAPSFAEEILEASLAELAENESLVIELDLDPDSPASLQSDRLARELLAAGMLDAVVRETRRAARRDTLYVF